MDGPFLRAQHYCEEAEKLRKLAGSEDDGDARKTLMEMAKNYESLAKKILAEGIAITKDQSAKPMGTKKPRVRRMD